ncbi:MAG: hypothetical protein IJ188_09645 [Clostridia bacterium]|nr:hypothetical protein [Clostridia bacterium]
MLSKSIPSTVSAFLAAHGAEQLAANGLEDLAALVRVFQEAAPAADSDPLSQDHLAYLTAVLDCLEVLNEQLYEHYRALIDIVREGVFRAPRERLLAYPSWNGLRLKAVAMGFLPEDQYGQNLPQPHLGRSEAYLRVKEGSRK